MNETGGVRRWPYHSGGDDGSEPGVAGRGQGHRGRGQGHRGRGQSNPRRGRGQRGGGQGQHGEGHRGAFRWQRGGGQGHPGGDQSQRGGGQGHRGGGQGQRGDGHDDNVQGEQQIDRPRNDPRYIGYKFLESLSNLETPEVLTKLMANMDKIKNFLNSPIKENSDTFALMLKAVATVTTSNFELLKLKFVLEVCNSAEFMKSLRNYLLELPYVANSTKIRNLCYWKNPNEFWENYLIFCEYIVLKSPTTALLKCRSLIEATTSACLEGLATRHQYELPNVMKERLDRVRTRLHDSECQESAKVNQAPGTASQTQADMQAPPEDFRTLTVLPTFEDLFNTQPFVRPNIIKGEYVDVEHYLDIQFRLLREDCIGPLRKGVRQYLDDTTKRRYENIRIFKEAQFLGTYINKSTYGVLVQFDKNPRRGRRWNNKRFMFGSLLLFTNNNFKDLIIATIVERGEHMLNSGQIAVSIRSNQSITFDADYLMVESEVYFEPYFHVLRALQDPDFPINMPMSKYIVHIDGNPVPPKYLDQVRQYKVDLTEDVLSLCKQPHVTVLDNNTWPPAGDLGFNDNQYEAYKLALTHEFSVIQGPPGTGKTYLGVKIAKTFLKNLPDKRILLICYTNHALDQFLEAILPSTQSIARIGGQSRSETLSKFNITRLRKEQKFHYYFDIKRDLESAVASLRAVEQSINKINEGVIALAYLVKYCPEAEVLKTTRPNIKEDPLYRWLFDGSKFNENEIIELEEYLEEDINPQNPVDDVDTNDVILDEFEESSSYDTTEITSFTLSEVRALIIKLQQRLHNPNFFHMQRDIDREILSLKALIQRYQKMANLKYRKKNLKIIDKEDPYNFSINERWMIYLNWEQICVREMRNKLKPLKREYDKANAQYEEARMLADIQVLKQIEVIGMTTTGAARLRTMLKELKTQIVIVEEAAEVLEGHIVTSLNKSCQHLILIGDHQQLRPSAASYKMAREYDLEVSLFERMITNGVHSRRLSVQHRMRPEIARLICPAIYPELVNHASVTNFPDVRGIDDSVFFFTHNFKEKHDGDSSSKSNFEEADLTLRLANYLMQQGYAPEDVTILAAYSGQMFYMRQERHKYAFLKDVKLTVVDNYQGEESKIILLSLVRNNTENKIGFLSQTNRVCVALSRAREGFYMFGNMEILKNNADIWKSVASTLESNASLGTSLRLRCENHPFNVTDITNFEDFDKVPEGGCLEPCKYDLACGHPCHKVCHGYDRNHQKITCTKKCERVLCELGHVCPLQCAVQCAPCVVPVVKVLKCKHEVALPCHQNPHGDDVKCPVIVTVVLPGCKHTATKPCHLNIARVDCPEDCKWRVEPCGHQCTRKCHIYDDPHHERYVCQKPCARAKKGCTSAGLLEDLDNHACAKRCFEPCDDCNIKVKKKRTTCTHSEVVACSVNVDDEKCIKNCARLLKCGHFCKKKCWEPCEGNCMVKVNRELAGCGHTVRVACGAASAAAAAACAAPCARVLACGHACRARCGQPCAPELCAALEPPPRPLPCGHAAPVPCRLLQRAANEKGSSAAASAVDAELARACSWPCGAQLSCGHACGGTCGACSQGRLHAPCVQPCKKINLCGHECKEPCNKMCPPCQEPCEIECGHSKCKMKCGVPCSACNEACSRGCAHARCTRRCGQRCTAGAGACVEPCPLRLACGHACAGLCGEPCLRLCRRCNLDTFPKDEFINLGDDYDDDARFIQMQDCEHIFEVDFLNHYMTTGRTSTETTADRQISIRGCPLCRKPILNTPRYKDLIMDMFRKEIDPIKRRVYGSQAQIKEKLADLTQKCLDLYSNRENILKEHKKLGNVLDILAKKIKNTGVRTNLLTIETQNICFTVIQMSVECCEKFSKLEHRALTTEFGEQIRLLSSFLIWSMGKMSEQQQTDLSLELRRTYAIIELSELQSKEVGGAEVSAAAAAARAAVLGAARFEEQCSRRALDALRTARRLAARVTQQERKLIVQAIGLKAGHWYKCPNGHIYCIGECGGATQESRCPECHERIGGTSHRLLASNRLAPEMDGASHAAWSDHYNNMQNFDIPDD